MKAQDSDIGTSGELTYGFVSNPALNKDHSQFNIDPKTGNITTAVKLDREKQEMFKVCTKNLVSTNIIMIWRFLFLILLFSNH